MHPRIYHLAATFVAAVMLSSSISVMAHARPVDSVTGEITAHEALIQAPEILANDQAVLQSIPAAALGTDIGTIGEVTLTAETRKALEAAIQTYTDEGREVSFVLLDLLSGKTIYSNTGKVLYSASCIKAPYIISCLSSGIASTDDMYKAGHVSDNAAYSRIRRQYGRTVMENWLATCDVSPQIARYNYCHLTSLDLAKMWLAMYSYIVGDEADSAFARRTLSGSLNSVIAAGPGSTRTAYSKAGWISDKQVSDYNVYNCGGVVMDRNPYIVTIMSNVPSTTEEAQALVDVLDIAHTEMMQ